MITHPTLQVGLLRLREMKKVGNTREPEMGPSTGPSSINWLCDPGKPLNLPVLVP